MSWGSSQEDLRMYWMQGFGFVNWGMAEPFMVLGRTGKGNIAAKELGTGKYLSWDT